MTFNDKQQLDAKQIRNKITNSKRLKDSIKYIKTDKTRGPNSNFVTNGPKAQNKNKHSSPDKIGRLHSIKEHWWSLTLFWPDKVQRIFSTAHEFLKENLKTTDNFMSIYINFMTLY